MHTVSSGPTLFISYSRQHHASGILAGELSHALTRRGYGKVILDVVYLKAGDYWADELEQSIGSCDVFVLLVSEEALASENVWRELNDALELKKTIVPIHVQFTRDYEGDERVLEEIQHLEWLSESDTPKIINDLASHVAAKPSPAPSLPRRRSRTSLTWAIAGSVALLFAVLFILSLLQVRALSGAESDEGARDAFTRLGTLRALVLPRLWLIGRWNPERLAESYFTRRADALDSVAAPLLGNRMRRDADLGLLLATLAAFKRGGAPSDAARDYAQKQHYALLDATLRGHEPLPGTALAVWRGPQRLLIAEGARVWSCPPDDLSRCGMTELPDLDAATDAAFVSETQIATVSVDGSVNQWDLGTFANPIGSPIREGDRGLSVAADEGNAAIVFAIAPRVVVILADGRRISAPRSMPAVTRATFGPCDRCLTLLSDSERVILWNFDSGRQWTLTDGALDAAATSGFVATAMRDGTVRFYDANRNPVRRPVQVNFESVRQLTLSPDGQRAAVVHDDVLSVVDSRGTAMQLIPSGRIPAPIAAAWAGDLLVTRTPSEVRLWRLERPSVADVAPGDAWRERRKQLGMTVDAAGHVAPGSGGPVQLGWNPVLRRIETQN